VGQEVVLFDVNNSSTDLKCEPMVRVESQYHRA